MITVVILSAILGMMFGSFANVIILRYGTGLGLQGRSKCFCCGETLKAIDLIPIFSFLFLKGKCRHCKAKISYQYILVELISALVFASITYFFWSLFLNDNIASIIYLVILYASSILLISISVYDIKHKIISDAWSYGLFALSIISLFVSSGHFAWPHWYNALAGIFVSIPIFLIWLFSKGRAMGFGDVKLLWGLGTFLGFTLSWSMFALAFWIGSIFSVILLLSKDKKYNLKSEVPFAPFLILAFFIVLFFKFDFFSFSLVFNLPW